MIIGMILFSCCFSAISTTIFFLFFLSGSYIFGLTHVVIGILFAIFTFSETVRFKIESLDSLADQLSYQQVDMAFYNGGLLGNKKAWAEVVEAGYTMDKIHVKLKRLFKIAGVLGIEI